MNLETLNGKIVVLLREISNPVTGNTLPVWCYMDYPREDVTVPRISVTQASGTESQIGIGDVTESGTFGVQIETSYDIDIWIKQGTKSTSLKMGGTQLRDYIGDLVIQKILDSRSTFCINGIIDIIITGIITQPYVDEFEWLRKTISIRITHLQSHS